MSVSLSKQSLRLMTTGLIKSHKYSKLRLLNKRIIAADKCGSTDVISISYIPQYGHKRKKYIYKNLALYSIAYLYISGRCTCSVVLSVTDADFFNSKTALNRWQLRLCSFCNNQKYTFFRGQGKLWLKNEWIYGGRCGGWLVFCLCAMRGYCKCISDKHNKNPRVGP